MHHLDMQERGLKDEVISWMTTRLLSLDHSAVTFFSKIEKVEFSLVEIAIGLFA